VKKLRKLKITDMEFDEFARLYFKMCSPYPEYLVEVWPNLVKMKKEIAVVSNANPLPPFLPRGGGGGGGVVIAKTHYSLLKNVITKYYNTIKNLKPTTE